MQKTQQNYDNYPQHPGAICYWENLYGGAIFYHLSQYLRQTKTFHLIVAPDNHFAQEASLALQYYCPEKRVAYLPDWETLPYDLFSPHQDLISERIHIFSDLLFGKIDSLILSVQTLMLPTPSLKHIQDNCFSIHKGETLHIENFSHKLEKQAYLRVSQVMQHGEYAIRGGIIDIFPSGLEMPLRLELFDNTIESIRYFDPENQRSTESVERITILAAKEFSLQEKSIQLFRENWRLLFSGNPLDSTIYRAVSEGKAPQGIEYYLPLFTEKNNNLFNFIDQKTIICRLNDTQSAAENFWETIEARYQTDAFDNSRPRLPSERLFLKPHQVFTYLKQYPQIALLQNQRHANETLSDWPYKAAANVAINHRLQNPLDNLVHLKNKTKKPIIAITESIGRQYHFADLCQKHSCTYEIISQLDPEKIKVPGLYLLTAPLFQGFETAKFLLITETELFGKIVYGHKRKKTKIIDPQQAIYNLAELHEGAAVVHQSHGVGRYIGLETMTAVDIQQEYIVLAFADNAKLYVPVTQLNQISRYSGMDPALAPLHKLGTQRWNKEKQKTMEKMHDVAADLLQLQAKRDTGTAHAFPAPDLDYARFVSAFPFEVTADQDKAINDVLQDLQAAKPMDRLVCGDVGFGKTEVAMRAAFIVAQANKQSIVLVPTTLLAEQHFQTFQERFADFAVNIACLSRFKTQKEQKNIIANIQEGKIDIIIGTHKLLNKSLQFPKLGLIILDEEHRFGVDQKEQLKKYKHTVDMLTLTATPIPRTLNLALSGMRDLSLIATPPAKRLSVKTFCYPYSKTVIREAVLREILRGGQLFYLLNDVSKMPERLADLKKIVPEAQIDIAHGQMSERTLEAIMGNFYHNRFNVLICSTIIETGIDIPNANTIIIEKADRFGLAQLHQLRGRVGRAHHQAYAYLLTEPEKKLSKDAEKRLMAITQHDDLGVGFILASQDLEIRGAGELLGDSQSGHIQEIGFSLYMDLLTRTIESLKAGKVFDLNDLDKKNVDINLQISAIIPEDYLNDPHQRLLLYKRLADATTEKILSALTIEMIDRFGPPPTALKNLFAIHQLRLRATQLGIQKIEANQQGGKIIFSSKTTVSTEKIIQLLQNKANACKFELGNTLRYTFSTQLANDRIAQVERLLDKLQ